MSVTSARRSPEVVKVSDFAFSASEQDIARGRAAADASRIWNHFRLQAGSGAAERRIRYSPPGRPVLIGPVTRRIGRAIQAPSFIFSRSGRMSTSGSYRLG
jgi:hypothetical protein